MSGSVSCEYRGDVAILRVCDASTRNAMTTRMVDMFLAHLDDAQTRARAILMTGEGSAFCSGASLGGDLDPNRAAYDAGAILESHFNPLMRALRDCSLPIVSAVNGVAAGVGCAIALSGDLIVVSESAFFLQAFQAIGLVPDGGTATLLVGSVGRVRALEMLLLGERLPAAKALEWGLISRVVPADTVFDVALALATRLAAGPTTALAMIRRQAWLAAELCHDEMLVRERDMQRDAGNTADHREGIDAFLSKRPAAFIGR